MMASQEKKRLLTFEAPPDDSELKLRTDQKVFAIIVLLPSLAGGMAVGFSAIALPELETLSLSEAAWFVYADKKSIPFWYSCWFSPSAEHPFHPHGNMTIVSTALHYFNSTLTHPCTIFVTASLPTLVAGLSLPFSGVCIDKFGRKSILLACSFTAAVGYYLTSNSTSTVGLFISISLLGYCQGNMNIGASIYIAESIAPDNLKTRNSLLGWILMSINIGITLDFILGLFFHYTQVALFGAIYSFISLLVAAIYLPESPTWLKHKGRYKEALEARKRLTFTTDATMSDLTEPSSTENDVHDESFTTYLKKLSRKDIYRPLCITGGLFAFLEFAGVVVYTQHQVDIIRVKYVPVNANAMVIFCGLLLIISQLNYGYVVPRIGLKKVAIISTTGTGLSSAILALCIYLNQSEHWYSYLVDYLHIFAVWVNTYFGAAIASATFTIVSELFPTDGRGFSSLTYMFNSACLFIASMSYQYAIEYIGYNIYIIFAVVSFCDIFYIHFFIPETVGKTLQELSDAFLR